MSDVSVVSHPLFETLDANIPHLASFSESNEGIPFLMPRSPALYNGGTAPQ